MASGQPLPLSRWLDGADARVSAFAGAFGLEPLSLGILRGAYDPETRRAAIFSHPLWRRDDAFWVEEQVEAADQVAAEREVSAIEMFDLLTLTRYPSVPAAWLTARDAARV